MSGVHTFSGRLPGLNRYKQIQQTVTDSREGHAPRRGDRFYCVDRVVLDADLNTACNIRERLDDPGIGLYTP